jgi:hypothetical protein
MTDPEDIGTRLARLTGATDALGPSPGFTSRVMDAVQREPIGLSFGLLGWAPRIVPVALFAAVAALLWAARAEKTMNEAMAVSYDAVEVGW